MAVVKSDKGVIGILTGGGDVPGLNPAIRAVGARLDEAIGVGVLIEETDIADLESRMEDLVASAPDLGSGMEELEASAPDVHEMYSHLLAASQNHLAAFEGWR